MSQVVIALLLSVALANETPLAAKCPKLSVAEREEIGEPEKFEFGTQLAWYARDQCVSMAEARRRMNIQATGPSAGFLRAIESAEAATFAGLWIQHQPTYGVVVAFTRNAKATLAKYTRDPLYIPLERPGPSKAELEAVRPRIVADLQRFGAKPTVSGVDITAGTVEIGYVGDLAAFRAAVARGQATLPSYLRLNGPRPLPLAAPPLPANWRSTVRAFPQVKTRSGGPEPDILRSGTLLLEGGCLRLKGERSNPVIVWPAEAALDLAGGQVHVLHRGSGERVAPGRIRLGGMAGDLEDVSDVTGLDAACPGPFYFAGRFGSMEPFDRADREERIRWYQREKKLTREAAEREVQAARQRQSRLQTIGRRIAINASDRFGGLWPTTEGAILLWVGTAAEGLAYFPVELRRFVMVQKVPRPAAELRSAADSLRDQLARLGLKASVSISEIAGRVSVQSEDLPALSRAAVAGKLRFPRFSSIGTNGAGPDAYREGAWDEANRQLEGAPDFAAIEALAAATWLSGQRYGDKVGPRRRMGAGEAKDAARYLVALGFTAADISRLREAGADPVLAWGTINGMAGPELLGTVVRDVAVGEVVELIPERLGDGSRTTAVMRLVEPLKGDRQRGETVRVRLSSGFDAEGKLQQSNAEPLVLPGLPGSLEQGSRWLLFLSPAFAAHHARLTGGTARTGDLVSFRYLVGLDGEQLDRRFEPDWWPKNLTGVRAALAPVDRAFDAANAAARGRLMTRTLP